MQLEYAALLGGDLADEVVVQGQIEEQPPRLGIARQTFRHRRAHARQAGDAQQELLRLALEAREDFREVIEDGARRGVVREFRQLAGELSVLEHQHDARCPALRAAFELRRRPRAARDLEVSATSCQLRRLETQAVTSDSGKLAGHPQPREAGRACCGS